MKTYTAGDRVKVLVDAPSLFVGGWSVLAGATGTVQRCYGGATAFPGYSVLLDFDPDQIPAYFSARELERTS